jgi:hypothetical protein
LRPRPYAGQLAPDDVDAVADRQSWFPPQQMTGDIVGRPVRVSRDPESHVRCGRRCRFGSSELADAVEAALDLGAIDRALEVAAPASS